MKYALAFFSAWTVFASSAQVSVYDCQSFDPVVLPATLEANEPGTFHKPCVLLDAANVYQFDTDDQLEIRADQYIHLEEGFHAGPFSATGNMHLHIKPQPDLDVFVMNYPDLNNVERFGKLELAVSLPANINALVQDFVQNGQSTNNINPFDPQELEIKAYFSPLYQGNWQNPWVGHGFYYEDFERSADTMTWNALPTEISNFRIRFAPRATGLWRCAITVYSPKTNEYFDLNEFQFKVVDVGLPDFMRVGENGKYFKVGGEPFYPFGMNMPTQSRYAAYTTEGTQPKEYVKFFSDLGELSDAGANYIRYMNQPYSTEIEFETLGDYSDRMKNAWEMDQLIDTLDSLDIKMHYCLSYTLPLTYTGLFGQYFWDWSAGGEAGVVCDILPNGFTNDVGYCYHTDPTYGVQTIDEFFSDPDLIRYYQNRLRYYISRWGYSTQIGTFEFMNEINFSGVQYGIDPVNCSLAPDIFEVKPYFHDPSFVEKLSSWQIEMARYIKEDLQHGNQLIAADYGGKPNYIPADNYVFNGATGPFEDGISLLANDASYQSQYIDIRAFSEYYDGFDKYEHESKAIIDYNNFAPSNIKPFYYAELGYGHHGCDIEQFTHKQLYVITPFSGSAGAGLTWHYNSSGVNWDDVAERNDAMSTIPVMKNFLDGVDLNQGDWVNDHDVRVDRRSEVVYLRNQPTNASKAIGVINNRTVNRYTMRENDCVNSDCDCYPEDLAIVNNIYETAAQFDYNDSHGNDAAHKLFLKHMGIFQEYWINYYDGLTGIYVSSESKFTDYQGWLQLNYPELGDTPYAQSGESNGAMLLIKVFRTSEAGFREVSDASLVWNDSLLFKQNDSKSIESNDSIKMNIAPNPTSADVRIKIENGVSPIGNLIITNLAGQNVFETTMTQNNILINTENWTNGLYYIVWNNGTITLREKLIVR